MYNKAYVGIFSAKLNILKEWQNEQVQIKYQYRLFWISDCIKTGYTEMRSLHNHRIFYGIA